MLVGALVARITLLGTITHRLTVGMHAGVFSMIKPGDMLKKPRCIYLDANHHHLFKYYTNRALGLGLPFGTLVLDV